MAIGAKNFIDKLLVMKKAQGNVDNNESSSQVSRVSANDTTSSIWTKYKPDFSFASYFDSSNSSSQNTTSAKLSNNFIKQTGYNNISLFDFNTNQLEYYSFAGDNTGGNGLYKNMLRKEAIENANKDDNLEKLKGGEGWSVATSCFKNDIPYAKKGINKLLDKLRELIGINFQITSALGTKNSPHNKGRNPNAAAGHYDQNNPKLDIQPMNCSVAAVEKLCAKFKATGLFKFVNVEKHSDGKTAHIDCQFSEEAFKLYA